MDCFGFLNQYALATGVVVVLVVILTRKVLNPLMQAKTSTSVPVEFLVVTCSLAFKIYERNNLDRLHKHSVLLNVRQ